MSDERSGRALSPLFSWRGAIADSSLPPTVRLVALVLSLHMSERGDSCFPSVATLGRESGLAERSVQRSLRDLEEAGYLTVSDSRGGRARTPRYTATVPDGPQEKGATDAPFPEKGATGDEKGDTVAPEVVSRSRTSVSTSISSVASATIESDPDVGSLCDHLADRIATFREDERARPQVTQRWRKDMSLLIQRGPLGRAKPEILGPERVRRCIDYVFEALASPQGRSGFCWAAQIRSPGALRQHYDQIREAKRQSEEYQDPFATMYATA